MLAAVGAFAVMDATMKELTQSYPPLQVSCLRGLTSIPFFLVGVAAIGEWRTLIPVRWRDHLVRGVLAIAMLWTFVYAVSSLALGTAYGIFLCSPLLITALSAFVLGDHVGKHRWVAVGCGMIGVFVILRPTGLARTDSTLSIGMSFMVMVSVGTGIAAWPHWVPIVGDHWPLLLLMGFTGALGQYLIIHAFRCAPPAVVAPFEYTALLWGIALDWILWSTVPSTRVLTGAGVVIVSGLYVIYREHWAVRTAA